MPYSDIKDNKTPWKKLPDNKAIFHQQKEGNENNEKWVHPDGYENVFKDACHISDDDVTNMATYNYFNDDTLWGIADVVPYYILGNSPSDMFTTDRFTTTWDKVIKPKLGIK